MINVPCYLTILPTANINPRKLAVFGSANYKKLIHKTAYLQEITSLNVWSFILPSKLTILTLYKNCTTP